LRKLIAPFALNIALTIPALVISFGGFEVSPLLKVLFYGLAVVASAFMLGWISEAAELDLRGGLAIGLLAVINILPEYVVDFYFAFAAGKNPAMEHYASANLTGANRLLLGFGWPIIALMGFLALRSRKAGSSEVSVKYGIKLGQESRVDLGFLIIASVLAFLVPLTGRIDWYLGVVLILLFVFYLIKVSDQDKEEPELEGIPALVGALPKWKRRTFLLVIALYAAFAIFISASPFADSLVESGRLLGINEFVLVQWVAPIATEAPEFIVAFMFALRGKPSIGLAVLVSSKVNQWTALAGSLPIAFAMGGGSGSLPMDSIQIEEFLLTIGQTVFGVALLLTLRLGFRASVLLMVLFVSTIVFPTPEVRIWISYLYFAISIPLLIWRRRELWLTIKAPFVKA